MNKDLLDILKTHFPATYSTLEEGYVSCGNGWFSLLYFLSEEIEKVNIENCDTQEGGFRFCQLKEKFGLLRAYIEYPEYGTYSDFDRMWVNHLINAAESMSSKICEECGEEGKYRPGGWVKTQCDACCDLRKKK